MTNDTFISGPRRIDRRAEALSILRSIDSAACHWRRSGLAGFFRQISEAV
uniref:Uncharacterized protein n=1 Tax=Anguilla anguilla TaxID=7936 RepID=A0A0E9TD63_ANGAN